MGPLLGGLGKRGEKSRLTLAKIVRGIATGEVRKYCEEREKKIAVGFLLDLHCLALAYFHLHNQDHAPPMLMLPDIMCAGTASQGGCT